MPPKTKAAKKPIATLVTPAAAKNEQPPNWPSLQPLLPASDLYLDTLLEDQIFTVSRLWTANLCRSYVTFLATLPFTTTPGKPKKGYATRVNDRYQIDDALFAEQLWSGTALKELITNSAIDDVELNTEDKRKLWGGEVLGLNSNVRIYRYSKGQFFDQHYDDSNNIFFPSASAPSPVAARTTWTLLLYLTSPTTGCIGGETVFYPDPPNKREAAPPPVIAKLEVGMALLHRHGKECLLHEGREVTEGEKWVIRSDLCVKQ